MLTHDDALARARAWFARRPLPEGVRTEVRISERGRGWIAGCAELRDDPASPPRLVGGPQLLIDRETGHILPFGSQNPVAMADDYAAVDVTDDRFPPDVTRVLHLRGWRPGRDASADVDAWLAAQAGELDGLTPSPAARALLNEFGGLWVQRFDRAGVLGGGTDNFLYPDPRGRLHLRLTRSFEAEHGFAVFPVGWSDDDETELVMDANGRVFALHWVDDFLVGADPDTAIVNLIRSDRWAPADL